MLPSYEIAKKELKVLLGRPSYHFEKRFLYHTSAICFLSLTDEQRKVLETGLGGHNLLLSGQAGTGKSFVVEGLVRELRRCGRRVVVVCSSGISSSVYGDGVKSCTVHSQYSLQTADMPAEMVVARAIAIPHVVGRIKEVDTIIWERQVCRVKGSSSW